MSRYDKVVDPLVLIDREITSIKFKRDDVLGRLEALVSSGLIPDGGKVSMLANSYAKYVDQLDAINSVRSRF